MAEGWLRGPGGGSHNRPSNASGDAEQFKSFNERKPSTEEDEAYIKELAKKAIEAGGKPLN